MLWKRKSERLEGDPECGEGSFKYGSRVVLIEKDLQLVKEPASQMSGGAPASTEAQRQERACQCV